MTVRCPAETHRALAGLARENGSTLFMVVQAATAAVLARSGGGSDVVVGSPVAGRADEALEDLVGFFVNTLVLRTDCVREPDVPGAAGAGAGDGPGGVGPPGPAVRPAGRGAQPRAVRRPRHPLFQVILAAGRRQPRARCNWPGWTGEPLESDLRTAKFDLTLDFLEHRDPDGQPAGLDIVLEYATDLYDQATAEGIGARLARVLDAAAADPDVPVTGIDLFGPAERRVLLAAGQGPAVAVPAAGVGELFAAQAARTPDAVAVVAGGRSVSYAEAEVVSGRLAGRLGELGVGPESVVGVLMERSADLVLSLLAVVRAGGAYLPLNPGYPAGRLTGVLADAGVSLVLADPGLAGLEALAEAGVRVVVVGRAGGRFGPGGVPGGWSAGAWCIRISWRM